MNGSGTILGAQEDLTIGTISTSEPWSSEPWSALAKTQVKCYPMGSYRYMATIESILGRLLPALFQATLEEP